MEGVTGPDGDAAGHLSDAGLPGNGSSIEEYLTTSDLDLLVLRYGTLDIDALSTDDREVVRGVLDERTDPQAVGNLLMRPRLIPDEQRHAQLQRGLDAEHPYVRLAAAVGLAELASDVVDESERRGFVTSLLALIRTDPPMTAERASYTLGGFLREAEAPEALGCLAHISPGVRHNVAQALLAVLGTDGLAALLDEPGFVDPGTRDSARAAIGELGLDLAAPAGGQRRPALLAHIPNYTQFDRTG